MDTRFAKTTRKKEKGGRGGENRGEGKNREGHRERRLLGPILAPLPPLSFLCVVLANLGSMVIVVSPS